MPRPKAATDLEIIRRYQRLKGMQIRAKKVMYELYNLDDLTSAQHDRFQKKQEVERKTRVIKKILTDTAFSPKYKRSGERTIFTGYTLRKTRPTIYLTANPLELGVLDEEGETDWFKE